LPTLDCQRENPRLKLSRELPIASGVRLVLALLLVMVVLPPATASATGDSVDPLSQWQWTLHNPVTAGADMDVTDAWATSRGANVTVAVVDTGVDTVHPDLAGQIDVRSRNFASDGAEDQIDDLDGHGTKVAGVIAAQDNSVGTIGVAPDAQVLVLRAFGADGVGDSSAIAAAFNYAGDLGVPIVNASFNGPSSSAAIEQAIASHPGTLFVVAAGNDYGTDDDAVPTYPCDLPDTNLVCVGASTDADAPADFSNVGAHNVDLFAPGADVLAPVLLNGTFHHTWNSTSGTSIAAANVAGVAALALSAAPALTTAQLKAAVLDSGDALPALAGLSLTGRRANAAKAVALAQAGPVLTEPEPALAPPPAPPAPPVVPIVPATDPPDVPRPAVAAAATAPVVHATVPAVVSFRVRRHGRRATATARANHAATLQLRIERRRCSGARCAWRTVAAHTVKGRTSASLSKRLAGGRYRATVALRSAAGAAKPRQRAFTVR
jgi:subtilisin family serine protease